ncbi:MAG: tRNA (adenosine(37)-N6)-threonylcarbamoyltransferase complex ATPase subunit type 1 TsaE [Bacteroidetes bacterium]|nr:tRNA (adenosine(37)-N6)-threonylcarbamoyltransferase complex ATPase subunit type 1 TsaE [Bacteroidota bacterium]MDA1019217.1 tRNA (adenosine(37)-N6)-threonylcarbamoyltransferase complex ATPase subunit type 1 TsaE [Bacteroidota bacterium]
MEFEYNLDNLKKASEFILKNSKSNLLLFSGVIGAGKTTLIKQLCKDIGVLDVVNSPTYSIINVYKSKEKPVFHMDLFRVKKDEIDDLGLLEYLESGSKIIIEWPEIIIDELEEDYTHVKIYYNKNNMRKLKLINTI